MSSHPGFPLSGYLPVGRRFRALLLVLPFAWCLCQADLAAQLSQVTVGDGVTSFGQFNGANERPFMEALAAAAAASGGSRGTQVEVLAGNYQFAKTVEVTLSGVTIHGARSAILAAHADLLTPLFRVTGDGFRMAGIQIHDAAPDGGSSLLRVTGDDFTLDGCRILVTGPASGAGDYHAVHVGASRASAGRTGTLVRGNSFVFGKDSAGVVGFRSDYGTSLRLVANEFVSLPALRPTPAFIRGAIQLRNESMTTISGNTFIGIWAPTSDQVENSILASISDGAVEGHHLTITGNFFEQIRAHSLVCLAGGKFVTLTGNSFGRASAPFGCIRIVEPPATERPVAPSRGPLRRNGHNPDALLGNPRSLSRSRSNLISGNQFHNVTAGSEASQRAISVDAHGGLLSITHNQFNGCRMAQIQIGKPGASIDAVHVFGNQFEASCATGNISEAIRIDAGAVVFLGSNVAYRNVSNGCTWQQVYTASPAAPPPIDEGSNAVY